MRAARRAMAGRWRRRLAIALVATASVSAAAGCAADGGSSSASPGAPSNRSATTSARAGSPTTAPVPTGTVRVGSRTRLEGFEEVTITVVDAAGTSRTFCLMLANTQALREQGLMFVTDPTLGGYDGMLFAFEDDSDGAFWMRNTRLPLSIAYLRADGSTTATTDMAPCPDDAKTCPVYPPGGTYRNAIEVPAGGLARLGISDRSRIEVGGTSCAPATTSS